MANVRVLGDGPPHSRPWLPRPSDGRPLSGPVETALSGPGRWLATMATTQWTSRSSAAGPPWMARAPAPGNPTTNGAGGVPGRRPTSRRGPRSLLPRRAQGPQAVWSPSIRSGNILDSKLLAGLAKRRGQFEGALLEAAGPDWSPRARAARTPWRPGPNGAHAT